MRIFQVTDTHIPDTGDMLARDNFTALMTYCAEQQPDLLAITGDLPADDGSRSAYEWITAAIPSGLEYIVIPGNHDNIETLFEVFGGGKNQDPGFFEKLSLDQIDVLFTNTASNELPTEQLDALANVRPGSVLFIHHPTKEVSGGWMDQTYPLGNRDEVDSAIAASNIRHVFCGHFHTEHEIHADYSLYVTPSPAFTVDLYADEPKISAPKIPLREVTIDGDKVSSKVTYLD